MKKSLQIISMCALALTLVFASCGGKDDPNPQGGKKTNLFENSVITFSSSEYDFDTVETGGISEYKRLTINESSKDSVFLDSITVSGDTSEFVFRARSGLKLNKKVLIDSLYDIDLRFKPKSDGDKKMEFTFYAGGFQKKVSLKGKSFTPALQPNVKKLNFKLCRHSCSSASIAQSITFKNTTDKTIAIESVTFEKGSLFQFFKKEEVKEVKAGSSLRIQIIFSKPDRYGTYEDKVIIKTNTGTFSVDLIGISKL